MYAGSHGNPDLTISVSEADFIQLYEGKLNPQSAFLQKKITVKGNMGLAMKFPQVLKVAKDAQSKSKL